MGTALALRVLMGSGPVDADWREQRVIAAMREIERYLDEYPNASDAVSGVRGWWLAGLAEPVAADIAQAALDRLVGQQAIESRTMPGGAVIYGRQRR